MVAEPPVPEIEPESVSVPLATSMLCVLVMVASIVLRPVAVVPLERARRTPRKKAS